MDWHATGLPLDAGIFLENGEAASCDCDGECCHEHSILLTHHDVNRLLSGVPGINVRELLIFFEAHAGYMDLDVLGGYPALMLDGGPCYMGLRFVVDENDARRHCRFLDSETRRCGINSFKPMVCRTYPFLVDNRCITRHRTIRCKRPYHPRDGNELLLMRATLQQAYLEFGEYHQKVAWWNENTRDASFDAFFATFFNV
jgi:Fe-S-cluster containining protein